MKAFNYKDLIMMVLGLAIMSFGYAAFILPENIVTGGVAGISSIIYFATDHGINIAIPNYLINLLLLVIAYRSVGRTFVIRTVIGATIFNIMLGVLTPLFTHPIVNGQPFMSVIIGAVFGGLGLGITYTHNGSSGGTDVVAAMVSKHSNVSFGRVMMYCDLIIISSSWFLFHNIETMVFGYVYLIIFSIVTDMVINSRNQAMQFLIFSEKWKEIADEINTEAHRGCTVLDGIGWYTKQEVKIVLVLCRRFESAHVQRIIKSVDDKAFISMTTANNVYGTGFDSMKIHTHKQKQAPETKALNGEASINPPTTPEV